MDIGAGGHGTAATPAAVGVTPSRRTAELRDDAARTETESAVRHVEKTDETELPPRRGQKVDVTV